ERGDRHARRAGNERDRDAKTGDEPREQHASEAEPIDASRERLDVLRIDVEPARGALRGPPAEPPRERVWRERAGGRPERAREDHLRELERIARGAPSVVRDDEIAGDRERHA